MKLINLVNLIVYIAYSAAAITNVSVNLPSRKFVISPRIIGGKTAIKGQFPYFVPILRCGFDRYDYYCGGVILSNRHVLSDGWCLTRLPPGIQNTCIGPGMTDRQNDKPLIKVQVWREYRKQPQELRYTLVLFKAYEEIIFNAFVQPIALPTEKLPNGENTKAATMGFGESTPNVGAVLAVNCEK